MRTRRTAEAIGLDQNKLPEAAQSLDQVRMSVAINLALGVVTAIAGGTGRYW